MKINQLVGENVRKYIESRGISHSWVMERTGIKKTAYYNFLNGKGNVEQYLAKINRLFRIEDPFYFYRKNMDFEPPTLYRSGVDEFMSQVSLSFHGEKDEAFMHGMRLIGEFVELIDVLQSVFHGKAFAMNGTDDYS